MSNGLLARHYGIPLWLHLVLVAAIVVISFGVYGPQGLPPDRAPLGFKYPLALLAFALLMVLEVRLFRVGDSTTRPDVVGRITALVGYALLSNANGYAWLAGIFLALAGTFLVSRFLASHAGQRTRQPPGAA